MASFITICFTNIKHNLLLHEFLIIQVIISVIALIILIIMGIFSIFSISKNSILRVIFFLSLIFLKVIRIIFLVLSLLANKKNEYQSHVKKFPKRKMLIGSLIALIIILPTILTPTLIYSSKVSSTTI